MINKLWKIKTMRKRVSSFFILICALSGIFIFLSNKNNKIQNKNFKHILMNKNYHNFNSIYKKLKTIKLEENKKFRFSNRPIIKLINNNSDFVILDKLNKRQIIVYDSLGRFVNIIGKEGKQRNEYIYPHNIIYSSQTNEYFVYDQDARKIKTYDNNFKFTNEFSLPLIFDTFVSTNGKIFYCLNSGNPFVNKTSNIVFKVDDNGKIINSFCKISNQYYPDLCCEGGGLIAIGKYLYVVQVYEYKIEKYDFDGKLIKSELIIDENYDDPPRKGTIKISSLNDAMKLHNLWSHIRQIINIDNKMFGIIYAQKGEKRLFLNIFDTDIRPIAKDILMPNYVGEIITKGKYLYLLRLQKNIDSLMQKYEIIVYKQCI
jgi:hypothetical protein